MRVQSVRVSSWVNVFKKSNAIRIANQQKAAACIDMQHVYPFINKLMNIHKHILTGKCTKYILKSSKDGFYSYLKTNRTVIAHSREFILFWTRFSRCYNETQQKSIKKTSQHNEVWFLLAGEICALLFVSVPGEVTRGRPRPSTKVTPVENGRFSPRGAPQTCITPEQSGK